MPEAYRELTKLAFEQQRLLPQQIPEPPGYRFTVKYQPAYLVAGDYYDFFERPDGSVAIFLGDGCGHGPAAGLLMAGMRAIFHTHPNMHTAPGDALTHGSRMFQSITPPELFMTGVYLVVEGAGKVTWASAGHDPPVRFSSANNLAAVDLTKIGFPLGLDGSSEYGTVEWKLSIGERLILFTDGVVEASNFEGEAFSRKRLRSVLATLTDLPLDTVINEIVSQLDAHRQGSDANDDYTIVGIERCS